MVHELMTVIGSNTKLPVEFEYTNHRGVKETRTMIVHNLYFGTTEHHTERQFFLHGFCMGRRQYRSFALKDIENIRWVK